MHLLWELFLKFLGEQFFFLLSFLSFSHSLMLSAWITVDNIIYFWNYLEPSDVDLFDGSKEVIISVAVSVPKSEIFSESVKFVLVIATSVDVSLLAICIDAGSSRIKLVPTTFILPADNISMLKIVGSQVGRLFMIGNDQCLYELDYSFTSDAWTVLSGSEPKHMCRKINFFTWNWHLNDFVRPFVSNFFSTDALVDLTVDNARNIVYCVTSNALISAVFLGESGKESILLARNFDIMSATKHFLASPRAPPESSPKVIRFSDVASPEFNVIHICPISLIESKKVHAMVTLANGIRIYLSFVSPNGIVAEFIQNVPLEPIYIEVCGVRSPPPVEILQKITARDTQSIDLHAGYFPAYNQSQPQNFSAMFYSKGVTMLSKDGISANDELLCFCEDLSLRGNPYNSHHDNASMKEVVSMVIDSHYCGNKIYDVKEDVSVLSDPLFCKVFGLFVGSLASDKLDDRDKTELMLGSPLYYSNYLSNQTKGCRSSASNIATLGELSLQHIPMWHVLSQRQFLVLTEQGLSVVKKLRPADILYQILSQNIYHTDVLQQFIGAYGECLTLTMCVGLAVGLPYDAGGTKLVGLSSISNKSNGSNEGILSETFRVVRVRAMEVLLKLSNSFSQPSPLSTKLPLSYHCNALFTVFGRIVRPIWRLDVTANRDTFTLSWDVSVNNQLRLLLSSFKEMLLNFFSSIIMNDKESFESIEFVPDVTDNITNHILDASKRIKVDHNMVEAAKDFDNMCIKSLYFVANRSMQALALLELYVKVQHTTNSLSTTQFKNISFCDLATSSKVIENVKQFNREVFQSISNNKNFCEVIRDGMWKDCYYFFSEQERLIYTAKEAFYLWRQPFQQIENVDTLMEECIQAYIRASCFWNGGELILSEHSEFVSACANLRLMGESGLQAVEIICLNVANQFVSDELKVSVNLQGISIKEELPWDYDKFNFKSCLIMTDEIRSLCLQRCYDTLCETILSLLNDDLNSALFPSGNQKSKVALKTIHRIVLQCRDIRLFRSLFKTLDDNNQAGLLVQVNSPILEEFLKSYDPNLLYTYYR